MAAKDTDQGFEWVVSESGFETEAEELAPPEPEVVPQLPKPRELWHLPRRLTWQYVVLPTIAVIAAVWGYIQWRDWQTREQIQTGLVIGAPAPNYVPLNFLRSDTGRDSPPQLQSLTPLDGATMRVEALYPFVAPDGSEVKFVVPLRFERRDDIWSFAGTYTDPSPDSIHKRSSPHLELRYLAADTDFMMETLGPYLDEVLNTACEEWVCAEGVRVQLDFANPAAAMIADHPPTLGAADDPLLVHILLNSSRPSALTGAWALPPPHVAGYPADAVSLQLYRRTVALQTIIRLASLISTETSQPENGLFYALLARQAARWGLESPEAVAVRDWGERWSLDELSRPVNGVESARALKGTLALLDELLHDQPPELEAEVFRATRERRDTFGMLLALIGGLGQRGVEPVEVLRRMHTVLDPEDGEAWQPRPGFTPEAVLMCESGLIAYGAGQTQRLLPGVGLDGFGLWPSDWSPDGRRLALGTFLLGFVLDLQTGETRWTPDISGGAISLPVGFTASGALAYHRFDWPAATDGEFDITKVEWRLFDPHRDAPARTEARGLWSLGFFLPFQSGPGLSPDRRWAIVTEQPDEGGGGPLQYSILSTEDGGPSPSVTSHLPAWSPDSRLAFFSPQAASDAPLQLLVRDDPASPETRTILSFDWQPPSGREMPQVVWSPAGDRLAFILGTEDAERVALGVVAANGEGLQLAGVASGGVGRFAFSPDGTTLSVLLSEEEAHNLVLYDSASLRPVRTLVGRWRDFSWAADGRLWLFNDNGVFTLEDAGNPLGEQPSRLIDQQCGGVLWQP